MPRYVCCLKGEPEPYFVWSTISDGPITGLLSLEDLRDEIRLIYEGSPPKDLEERIKRAEERGTCSKFETLEQLISFNRLGRKGGRLHAKTVIRKLKKMKESERRKEKKQ